MPRAQPDGSDIRTMGPADVEPVAHALAESFHDDPVWSWLVPDPARRPRVLERSFDLWLRRLWLRHDACFTSMDLVGGALWAPPGHWHVSALGQLRLMPPSIAIYGRYAGRAIRMLGKLDARHPRAAHWYLPVIGVAPEHQGRGFGSALMKPILDRCDRDGVPAYLESSSERSRALYERNGFAVREELRFAPDAPPMWLMWREPGGS
jgi:GNAT superfamily N-acetyltransferase